MRDRGGMSVPPSEQIIHDRILPLLRGPLTEGAFAGGRKARGKRAMDLLIAATAAAADLPLYTRNIDDFSGLEGVVEIVEVGTNE